jgi:hypothetical protein
MGDPMKSYDKPAHVKARATDRRVRRAAKRGNRARARKVAFSG